LFWGILFIIEPLYTPSAALRGTQVTIVTGGYRGGSTIRLIRDISMRLLRFTTCLLSQLLIPLWAAWAIVPQSEELRDSLEIAQIGLLPLPIFFYTPETGFAGGAAVLVFYRADRADRQARPSTVTMDIIYTQKKQIIAEFNPDIYLNKGLYRLTGSIIFIKYPQKFFGIGNSTPDRFEESYSSRAFRVTADAVRRVSAEVSAGVSLFYETRSLSEFRPSGLLEPGTILGSRGGTTVGAGIVVQWDTRDNIFAPTEGRYYQLSVRSSHLKLGSDFDFTRVALDMREYLHMTETTVLAIQALVTLINGSAPFHKLAALGGQSMMRGYYEGRYLDNKLLAGQVEYRIPIFWRFGAVAFAGAGDVASTMSRFNLRDLKPSYGFGIRYVFNPDEKLSLRLDFGFGRNTSGVYITAAEAF